MEYIKRHPVLREHLKIWIDAGLTSGQSWEAYQDAELWTITDREKSMTRGRFNNVFYAERKTLSDPNDPYTALLRVKENTERWKKLQKEEREESENKEPYY